MRRRWWWSATATSIIQLLRPPTERRRSHRSCGARPRSGRRRVAVCQRAAWPELTQMLVKVAPRRVGDPGRIATVALRAGPVTLKRPRNGFAGTDPETVSMTLVQAREINPPANEEPLRWHLLTTIEVADAAAACEIVRLYRLRWRIEEVFRALKSDGMRLGETQVHEASLVDRLKDQHPRSTHDCDLCPSCSPPNQSNSMLCDHRTRRSPTPHSR